MYKYCLTIEECQFGKNLFSCNRSYLCIVYILICNEAMTGPIIVFNYLTINTCIFGNIQVIFIVFSNWPSIWYLTNLSGTRSISFLPTHLPSCLAFLVPPKDLTFLNSFFFKLSGCSARVSHCIMLPLLVCVWNPSYEFSDEFWC